MKKVRVSLWVGEDQKERLEALSRKKGALISEYIQEAIEDLLNKHEQPKLRLVHDDVGAILDTPENDEDSGEKRKEIESDAVPIGARRAGGG